MSEQHLLVNDQLNNSEEDDVSLSTLKTATQNTTQHDEYTTKMGTTTTGEYEKVHSRTNLLSRQAQRKKFLQTLRKNSPFIIIGGIIFVLGVFLVEYEHKKHPEWHFLALHDSTWVLWFGLSLILVPINRIIVHFLFKLLLRWTYWEGKKYTKGIGVNLSSSGGDHTLSAHSITSTTNTNTNSTANCSVPDSSINNSNVNIFRGQWKTLFYFVPIEKSFRRVLFVTFSFLIWVLLIYIFDDVDHSVYFDKEYNEYSLWHILTFKDSNDDVDNYDVLLTFYRVFLCCLLAVYVLFLENIIVRWITARNYLKQYFIKFEKLLILERLLCSLLNRKHIFTPNLTNFLLTYPSHPKPSRYFETSHIHSFCLCCDCATTMVDKKIVSIVPDTLENSLVGKFKNNQNNDSAENDDNDDMDGNIIDMEAKDNNAENEDEFDDKKGKNSEEEDDTVTFNDTKPRKKVLIRNDSKRPRFSNFNQFCLNTEENLCPKHSELWKKNKPRNRSKFTQSQSQSQTVDGKIDRDIHCPLWSHSAAKDKSTAMNSDKIVNLSRLYAHIIYNKVSKFINDSPENVIFNTNNLQSSISPSRSRLNIAALFSGITLRSGGTNALQSPSRTVSVDDDRDREFFGSSFKSHKYKTSKYSGDSDGSIGGLGSGSVGHNYNNYPKIRNYLVESDFVHLFLCNNSRYEEGVMLFDIFDVTKSDRVNLQSIEECLRQFFENILNARSQFESYKQILNSLQSAGSFYTHFVLIFFYLIIFDFDFSDALSIYASLILIGVYFGSNPISNVIDGVTLIFILQPYTVGDVIQFPNDETSYRIQKITLSCLQLYFFFSCFVTKLITNRNMSVMFFFCFFYAL